MATLNLPVRSDVKSYTFTIDLNGATFTLRFRYNERGGIWFMDVADAQDNGIVNGVPVQTNVDLLSQTIKESLPDGLFIPIDETGNERDAGENDLGNDIILLFQEAS